MEGSTSLAITSNVVSFATLVLNFIILVAFSPIFWISIISPSIFSIAWKSLRLLSYEIKQDKLFSDLDPTVRFISEVRKGDPAYAMLDFTIQFFTLLTSLIGLNLAIWRMFFISAANASEATWSSLHPNVLALKGIILTATTLCLLFSGALGTPNIINSYVYASGEKRSFIGLTAPPWNLITISRMLCAAIAVYLLCLACYGLGVRIL